MENANIFRLCAKYLAKPMLGDTLLVIRHIFECSNVSQMTAIVCAFVQNGYNFFQLFSHKFSQSAMRLSIPKFDEFLDE